MTQRRKAGLFACLATVFVFNFAGCKADKGSTGGAQTKGSRDCEKACRVCNASEKDLRAEFGSAEVPKDYAWAMRFFDEAGYPAFQKCVKAAAAAGKTIKDLGCTEKALKACVDACGGGITPRQIYNKCSNGYMMEAARIVGVPTDRKPSPEELKKVGAEIEKKCGHLK